ncbi:helix-turn-helix transcriptional regulator [Staphylococcus hominis]|uniref:helix-turn-helix transcriptional regulator n=1 Tax=Staphylococcus hominis TaxID=1290 RepID=UPI00080E38BD|nr:helix-turn-helix domain-containing protein [Staphylococcus hominis]
MNSVLGYRKMINKTQKDIAKLLNISEQTYRKKEKGITEFNKKEMLMIKNLLSEKGLKNISIEDIFFT